MKYSSVWSRFNTYHFFFSLRVRKKVSLSWKCWKSWTCTKSARRKHAV